MSGSLLVSCTLEERALPYVEALKSVGVAGDAIRIVSPDRVAASDAAALAAGAAGLLLCGGPDLEPHHYGEAPHPHANLGLMPERDAVELELLAGARQARTPLFGVCRGLQMANAFLGGTLWQDLKLMWPNAVLHDLSFPRDALIHPVQVTVDAAGGEQAAELGAVLTSEPSLVNSRHHQAIKALAPALEAVASAPDGIVEAVAGVDPEWWLWAVQWHPENLVSLASQRRLFERFQEQVQARTARQASDQARAARTDTVGAGEPALR
jgi:putative glutamine amidotransferase